MAKPLTSQSPSSSVARLLDESAINRAVAPGALGNHDARTTDSLPSRQPVRSIKREVVLSEAAARTLDALLEHLRRGTGTRLSCSHAVRALLAAVEPFLSATEANLHAEAAWRLPPNGAESDAERIEFERRLAVALIAAMSHDRP